MIKISSSAHVVHKTTKQVSSHPRWTKMASEQTKIKNVQGVLNSFFSLLNMQICDVLVAV